MQDRSAPSHVRAATEADGGPGGPRDAAALTAARLYYLQDFTMDAIGRELRTSRSTVSRLLTYARDSGLVTIRVNAADAEAVGLATEVQRRFGVPTHVVAVPDAISDVDRLDRVAAAAAQVVAQHFDSSEVLGVAWGSTVSAISRFLPAHPLRDAQVVQMNGAGNTRTTGSEYASEILRRFETAFRARAQEFPVPAFFDEPTTKAAMWRERSIRRVLEMQRRMDLALFSVGSPFAEVPSHVYAGGYLESADFRSLSADRVVGDVGTVFYRADGSCEGIALNERSTGPELARLRRVSRRICVAAGEAKADALRGALAARLVTDLVVDEGLAHALVASA